MKRRPGHPPGKGSGWVRSSPVGGHAGPEPRSGPTFPAEVPRRSPGTVPARFYAPTGREGQRPTRFPAPATHSQEAAAGTGQAGRYDHAPGPRGICAPSTKATWEAPPVGVAVTISAGDARTSEGRGERRGTLVFSLGLPPSLADPYPGCFALTARAGKSRATSQRSVPLRDPLKCLCVTRRQGSATELEEDSAFSSVWNLKGWNN